MRLTASAAIIQLNSVKLKRSKSKRLKTQEFRPVWFDQSRPVRTPVYNRASLQPGHRLTGPAIIEQFDSMTVLHPGDRLAVDDALNLSIEVAA